MKKKIIKNKLNELFSWFEDNKFTNEGDWGRSVNLVFEFSDCIAKLSYEDIAEMAGVSVRSARALKKMACDGCNEWIGSL